MKGDSYKLVKYTESPKVDEVLDILSNEKLIYR
jgi:hypothetical protein